MASYLAELLHQPEEERLAVAEFAEVGDLREFVVAETILFLKVALRHENRERVLLLLHMQMLSDDGLQKLIPEVEGNILLNILLGRLMHWHWFL